MIGHTYLNAAREILDHLENTQLDAVEAAADLVVHAMQNGGAIYCSEIGHGIQSDFIYRAGGLVAVKHFDYRISVTSPQPKSRAGLPPIEPDTELANVRHAVRVSNLRPGDVMLVASVSGRNLRPVELALACRERGVKTIGFTAMTYTAEVESLHPSGKRLADAVDVVIDNGAPYGDAGIQVPGYDIPLVPMSGIGMVASGWLIWSRVMEKMAAAGTPASVLLSHNRTGGPEHNTAACTAYDTQG